MRRFVRPMIVGIIGGLLVPSTLMALATETPTPTPTTGPICMGDATGSGVVNLDDYIAVRDYFGQSNTPVGDANGDGIVNLDDYIAVRDNFGRECPEVTPTPTPGEVEGMTIMLPDDVEFVMVRIPAGSFEMGSPENERGRGSDEGPQTHVTLTQSFYMGKYPVTQAQWEAVMGTWPGSSNRVPSELHGLGPDYPAYYISWNDAQDFVSALNDHLIATDQGPATMRLPTEAEWEYAARAGTSTRYYFGDSLDCDDVDEDCSAGELPGNRSDYMWFLGNNAEFGESGYGAKPVGQKLPNAFGLYDMHGNVWEWCQDIYATSLPGENEINPTGPESGATRVQRGGAGASQAVNCRSATRFHHTPTPRAPGGGFRLAANR